MAAGRSEFVELHVPDAMQIPSRLVREVEAGCPLFESLLIAARAA
jgi:hypothetical protein